MTDMLGWRRKTLAGGMGAALMAIGQPRGLLAWRPTINRPTLAASAGRVSRGRPVGAGDSGRRAGVARHGWWQGFGDPLLGQFEGQDR